ncbi:MAG: Rossmann-like and DUF2520 domain-containing protein [Thermodesulfobacteriota bacterium]
MLKIGFIGAGITGTALAWTLYQKGFNIHAVTSRGLSSVETFASRIKNCEICNSAQEIADNCDLIFITTPDDIISSIASSVMWRKQQYVVHCSGAHSLDILEPAAKSGAIPGGFHPLQSFADIEQAMRNLPGSTFAIEAEEPLLSLLKDMAVSLNGEWILLKSEDKPLYHAAAVFASNYLVTLVKIAADLWNNFGVPAERACQGLLPLMRGTLENVQKIGLPNCLTGPVARGDLGTIKKHIETLKRANPEIFACYKLLGWHTIPIALAKGKISLQQAAELKKILKEEEK